MEKIETSLAISYFGYINNILSLIADKNSYFIFLGFFIDSAVADIFGNRYEVLVPYFELGKANETRP